MRWLYVLAALLFYLSCASAQIIPYISNPPLGPASILPIGPGSSSGGAPPLTGALLLEDGSSNLLLEDGSSDLCLEGGC